MRAIVQWRCILSDTDFKDFKPRASADASRIIKGWPTSAESLYDAFSKTSAESCAHSQHSAHFWHILVAAEKVFSRHFSEAIWLMLLSSLLSHCRHLHSKVCRGLSTRKCLSEDSHFPVFALSPETSMNGLKSY